MEWLQTARWSPYVVGVGIGILSWIALLVSDKTIGCSTTFSRVAGMIERLFRGDKVLEKEYYRRVAPVLDWQGMLVIGVVIGAFLSAQLAGTFKLTLVPDLWVAAFGEAAWPRILVALLGGVLMGIGSRWADGCTSGHGISGTLQLAVSSWVSAICFFIGGILTALFIFDVLAQVGG